MFRMFSGFVVFFFVMVDVYLFNCFFFFKQKTAYEMRISDWSSDVCSSDLRRRRPSIPDLKLDVDTHTIYTDTRRCCDPLPCAGDLVGQACRFLEAKEFG